MTKVPYKFSPSSLSLLKECPKCFWLKFRQNISRPSTIFPSLPSGMDRILKVHFDTCRAKGVLPPELASLNGEVKLFDNMALLDVWRNNFKGVRWTDEKNFVLSGAVDEILQKGDKLVVLDFKTRGFPVKDDTASYYQDQLDIYNFLLRKNGYKTEDYAYLLIYHPDKVCANGDVVFHKDLKKVKTNPENANTILEKAVSLLEGDMPATDGECGFCGWFGKCSVLPK